MSEHLDLAASFAKLLDRLDIDYVIGGSVASSLVGEPRSTVDIDIAVVLNAAGLEPLMKEVSPTFYVPVEDAARAVREHDSFNLIHTELAMKVDLFVLGEGVLDRNQLSRRVAVELPTDPIASVYITAAEDQVLRKLDWHRRSSSDRQWRDVVAILRLNRTTLDYSYLETTAESVELSTLLDRALSEAAMASEVIHVDLHVVGASPGATQPVPVHPRTDRTFVIAYTPGFVEGIAAGDVIVLTDAESGSFNMLERGGNLAIKWATREPVAPFLAQAEEILAPLAARLDGSIGTAAVWTVPIAAGFEAVETAMAEIRNLSNDSDWWFGNVYDTDGNPLNWWLDG